MAKFKSKVKATGAVFVTTMHDVFGKYTKLIIKGFSVSLFLTGLCIFLALLMCILGIVIIISKDELTFVNTLGTSGNYENLDVDGSNLSEYEKWVLMAQALDRDLILSDYLSGGSYEDLYNSATVMSANARSTQTPAKDIDIFLMFDEIYKNKALNGESTQESILPVEYLYGTWQLESNRSQGTGNRLIDSEVLYHGSSYYDPIGSRPSGWSVTNNYNGGSEIGCTYICKDEWEDLDDSKRGIFGGSAMRLAGKSYYITADSFSYKSDNTSNLLKSNDEVYTYLDNFKIVNDPSGKRGCITWLPDAIYTVLYETRANMNGLDRHTHSTSGAQAMANKVACDEINKTVQLTKEQYGILLGGHSLALRLTTEVSDLAYNNTEATDKEVAGLMESWWWIALREGFIEETAEEIASDRSISAKICNDARTICKYLIGEVNKSGSHESITYSKDSVYGKVYEAIQNNTLKNTYPDELIEKAKQYKDTLSDLKSTQHLTAVLCSSYCQCAIRQIYGIGNYLKGHCIIHNYGKIIERYYNYEENGDHKYRLYDVNFGEETTVSTANGTGPFGLPYYNSDGSVNEEALLAAHNLFIEITDLSYKNSKTITVPDSITIQINNDTKTFTLRGGEYPNFWGATYNNNTESGWGQCTWWARGRAMLWLYENVSEDIEVWGIYNSHNGNSRGNGDVMAGNLARDHNWLLDSNPTVGAIGSAQDTMHVYYIEAVTPDGNYYISHGNMAANNYETTRVKPKSSFVDNWGLTKYPCSSTYHEVINAGTGGGYSYIEAILCGKTWKSKGIDVCHLNTPN